MEVKISKYNDFSENIVAWAHENDEFGQEISKSEHLFSDFFYLVSRNVMPNNNFKSYMGTGAKGVGTYLFDQ